MVPVLLLGAGGWWWTQRSQPDTPSATASQTPGAQSPSSTPSVTPDAGTIIPSAIEVPGPGTVQGVKAQLTKQGFRCEQESQPGMDAWLCTRYDKEPTMMAFVAGATGQRLGRVALSVQDGPGGKHPQALGLQEYLANQVAKDPAQAKQFLTEVRAGDESQYASTAIGPVVARGSSDGSIVMFVNGWVPSRAQPAHVLPLAQMDTSLSAMGYACSDEVPVRCTRKEGRFSYEVDYIPADLELSYLKVKVTAAKGTPVKQAGGKEVNRVVGLLQEGEDISTWLARHSSETGATGYQDGMSLDWYPAMEQPDGEVTIFYLREACWTDSVEVC